MKEWQTTATVSTNSWLPLEADVALLPLVGNVLLLVRIGRGALLHEVEYMKRQSGDGPGNLGIL